MTQSANCKCSWCLGEEAVNRSKRKRYVACPNCGDGLARNWLKCRDPEWKHCKECAEIIKQKQDAAIAAARGKS
jgi:uncharacterized protein (DUF983 family)